MERDDRTDWLELARRVQPDTVMLRRSIHEEPELGLQTHATAAKVLAKLQGLPLRIARSEVGAGIIATLETGRPGRTVLLRADMDALPFAEETELDFASRVSGAMHACGHDAHTAMLASAARLLSAHSDHLCGRIQFMFQPGEETGEGAKIMLDEGLLDAEPPDAVFALHVSPNRPSGVLFGRSGPALASGDLFEIEVIGRGGHGAMPHSALDLVPAACEIVLALQSFVTRRINVLEPAILTVGIIAGGSAKNVIPDRVALGGTLRALTEATRDRAKFGIEEIVANVARAHGCQARVEFGKGYPATINDPKAVSLAERSLRKHLGTDAWQPQPEPAMASEDFSYLLQRFPGAMLFLGACPEGMEPATASPCHSSRMVMNEAAMATGVAVHCILAQACLLGNFE